MIVHERELHLDSLADAMFMAQGDSAIIEVDFLWVCVTFMDELASLDEAVSMVSTVDPSDPSGGP